MNNANLIEKELGDVARFARETARQLGQADIPTRTLRPEVQRFAESIKRTRATMDRLETDMGVEGAEAYIRQITDEAIERGDILIDTPVVSRTARARRAAQVADDIPTQPLAPHIQRAGEVIDTAQAGLALGLS